MEESSIQFCPKFLVLTAVFKLIVHSRLDQNGIWIF